ncbi:MAG: hypothetical protein OXR72_12605 [Gemmatimonadota bacterium]|nr:hypothetical protein [Gemmatimonadota bacterium]
MHPEWRNTILFIDGLDEVRAGAANASTPFDEIRNRLKRLGRPRFRLSCREADWLGENDWQRLTTVSPGLSVSVLRLDPLGEADILRILSTQEGIEDPKFFIDNARERRIDGLLQNPLTLELLATVIARGEQWPESRLQTFEDACLHLVREHNTEHKVANQPVKTNQLLDAAGRLCAVQLISGIEGYTQVTGDPDSDFPALEEMEYENRDALQSVLSTKLFKAESSSPNRFGPIHRHVAEYLGARYLAGLIEEGLPARRILSLISGEDGIVVTALRGLSAWLAAHCNSGRRELIERDPVGVGLYGDIRGFRLKEKEALLKTLSREASRLGYIEIASAFGPLATPDMESALMGVLNNPIRESNHQSFVSFVLRFLGEGSPLPNLSDLLLDIVRDETRWPGINVLALDAYILCEDEDKHTSQLMTLLSDIQNGSVSDPDRELVGKLLSQLYPRELSPADVWAHLVETPDSNIAGAYRSFWEHRLLEKSTNEQAVELLDGLIHRFSRLTSTLQNRLELAELTRKLLARVLPFCGETSDAVRLYDWLSFGFADVHGIRSSDGNTFREIRSWIAQRPKVQKRVIAEGLKRCPESDKYRNYASNVQARLYGANLPHDFGHWCLKRAVATACQTPRVAEYFLELAWRSYTECRGNESLTLELLEKLAGMHKVLKARLTDLRTRSSIPRGDRVADREGQRSQYADRQTALEAQWLNNLRSNETVLRENRAPHKLLSRIAGRYFGASISHPVSRDVREIERDLGSDQSLINAVRLGILGVIIREDIPSVEDILALMKKSQAYHISWPFLAALEEIEKSAPHEITQLKEVQMRKALAFHFCVGYWHEPKWYKRIRDARPDVVADMLVRCGTVELRRRDSGNSGLFALLSDKENAKVATLASLPLLRAVPTRCNAAQNHTLDNLLWAALRHADRRLLGELIESKLATTSMNVGQRVHWLAAAAILSPETHVDQLEVFVQGQEKRTRHLVGFFPNVSPRAGFPLADIVLGIGLSKVLVRLIGVYFQPHQRWHDVTNERIDGFIGPEMQAAWLVDNLIQRLAGISDDAARDALVDLIEIETLSAWREVLTRARDSQRIIRRDAGYRHPKIEQVCQTLDGGSPANAADLAALVNVQLHEIVRNIHDGNTSDWRQYWEYPADEEARKPKHEELCRDALLSDLKYKLHPLPIDAQPEVRYANDTRADIRVCFEGFNVPVEIKRNKHQDLWTAIKTQLIAKYTRDPGAAGHGIYLVFWFGKGFTRRSPSGSRPDTPSELREGLMETLTDEEARRISVVVIDVSGEESESGQV